MNKFKIGDKVRLRADQEIVLTKPSDTATIPISEYVKSLQDYESHKKQYCDLNKRVKIKKGTIGFIQEKFFVSNYNTFHYVVQVKDKVYCFWEHELERYQPLSYIDYMKGLLR